jgi:hypothetical protein
MKTTSKTRMRARITFLAAVLAVVGLLSSVSTSSAFIMRDGGILCGGHSTVGPC